MKNILKKFGLSFFVLVFVLSVGVFVSSKTAFADDVTPPELIGVTHNELTKSVTYTWSEPIQLCNDISTPCTESAVSAAHMKIYAVTDGVWFEEKPGDTSTAIANPITSATWDGTGTILTVTYTDLLPNGDYVVDSYGYDIIDMAGNRYTGEGENDVSPIFTVLHPYLTAVAHNELAKTITYTWSEPIQLCNDVTNPCTESPVTAAKMKIYTVTGGVWYEEKPGDTSTATAGVLITSATFDHTGTILTIHYTGTLETTTGTDYVTDSYGYDIIDMAGNRYTGADDGSNSPIFTVAADNTDPTLTGFAHDETAKTITHTFSEPIQFMTKKETITPGATDAGFTPEVITESEIPSTLSIFVTTCTTSCDDPANWSWNVGGVDGTPSTIAPGVTITSARFSNDNQTLTIKYSGSLVKGTDYIMDLWVPGTTYGYGWNITDEAGNRIDQAAGVFPEFTAEAAHYSSGGGNYHPPVTPPENAGGCSAGNLFNTSTGAACVNNAVIPQGCSGGNLFNTANGNACANNTGVNNGNGNPVGHGPYNFGTTTLGNGSKGAAVMELQRFLNAKLALGLVVDGKLGPKTIAVIKKWQAAQGLVADGLVGAKTKAKMNAE